MPSRSPRTDVVTPLKSSPLGLKLVVVMGADFGRELRLERGTYRLGSAQGNDFALRDPAVSSTHLLIEVLADSAFLRDVGSTNGSYCNGLRFRELEARAGTRIRVGRTELKLLPSEAQPPALPPSPRTRFGELCGHSLAMRELFAQLERVAPSSVDVLLLGETGTGKEVCARSIHANSDRASGPFVVCDVSTFSPELIESELFGHVEGAFTGAHRARAGVFEQASGGTLFLDEVAELAPDVQPRLLGALERRTVKRLGSNAPLPVDVRVISATCKDLLMEVRAGRFRADLYHRVASLEITLPPLRERTEDIPLLVDELLARLGREPGALTDGTRVLLREYAWPGNVRELRNVVERAVSLGSDAALPAEPGRVPRTRDLAAASIDQPFTEARDRLLAAFERDYIANLLAACGGNVRQASRTARIDRAYLYRLMKKHALVGRE